jgi:hypothetical protein
VSDDTLDLPLGLLVTDERKALGTTARADLSSSARRRSGHIRRLAFVISMTDAEGRMWP